MSMSKSFYGVQVSDWLPYDQITFELPLAERKKYREDKRAYQADLSRRAKEAKVSLRNHHTKRDAEATLKKLNITEYKVEVYEYAYLSMF